jgi:hypothetical protein
LMTRPFNQRSPSSPSRVIFVCRKWSHFTLFSFMIFVFVFFTVRGAKCCFDGSRETSPRLH